MSRPLSAFVTAIQHDPAWTWTAMWWRLAEVIVAVPPDSPNRIRDKHGNPKDTWSTKALQRLCPPDVTALGCTGTDPSGKLAWVLWDLDVGHGRQAYACTEDAVADARRIRDALEGHAEIRMSKSGLGIHVRHCFEEPLALPAPEGPKLAKALAAKLKIKADPSALGRQACWLWTRHPAPNAFRLIERHEGIAYHE